MIETIEDKDRIKLKMVDNLGANNNQVGDHIIKITKDNSVITGVVMQIMIKNE